MPTTPQALLLKSQVLGRRNREVEAPPETEGEEVIKQKEKGKNLSRTFSAEC